ncbi:ClpP/crotonase [Dentipellis sp. KUC8613]|nr:ClpP/crotonase [Dentipellis sp. KUC8613]
MRAASRVGAIARHMASAPPPPPPEEPKVLFEENLALRRFILNRDKKMNALDGGMLDSIGKKVEHWNKSDLAGVIVGSGNGRAFCAGGDVADVVLKATSEETRKEAIDYFRLEFGVDYTLACLRKPYVAVMDGLTFGGGAGLAAPALFRVATEKTAFSMPETKIGYFPDVGASYFLSRLDGELGTYLALTGEPLSGRATFEHGFATHFISSHRVPILLERLAALEDPTLAQIDSVLEELYFEREPTDPATPLIGAIRVALDSAFAHNSVEEIIKALEGHAAGGNADVIPWAKNTLASLNKVSPTSLRVALLAIRKAKTMNLLDVLKMEASIAAAFCSGATPDFQTGVTTVIVKKIRDERPEWSPSTLSEVNAAEIEAKFFKNAPQTSLILPEELQEAHTIPSHFTRFALPTEEEIGKVVKGEHPTSDGEALTAEEVVAKFESLRRGKHGVSAKVREVLARRCVAEGKGEEAQYLRWKH